VGLPQAATFLINAGRLPFLVLFLGAFMLLFSSALHPLLLNSFEALWTPSRRALYMARLLRWLWWVAWFSLWASVAFDPPPWREPAVVLFIVLCPVAFAAIQGVETIFETSLGTVGRTLYGFSALALVACFLAFMFGSLSLNWTFLVGMQGLCIAGLALQVWGVIRIEPWQQIELSQKLSGEPSSEDVASTEPRVHIAASSEQSLGHALASPVTRGTVGRIGPALLLQGYPSLSRMMMYYALADWRYNPEKGWSFIFYRIIGSLLMSIFGFFLFGLLMVFFVDLIGRYIITLGPDLGWRAILCLFIGWFCVHERKTLIGYHVENPERLSRLYLLGVNYRSLLCYRLKTFWASPVLLLSLAIVGAVALLSKRDTALLLWIAALAISLVIFRAGWWDWPRLKLWRGLRWLMTGSLLLSAWAITYDVLGGPLLILAVATLLGIVGIITKFVVLDEETLRSMFRQ
jgi:hypothetical protein